MKESKNVTRTEYTIQYKTRKESDKWQGWITDRYKTYEEAKRELDRRVREERATRQRGYSTSSCGGIGISCKHYSEYDTIAFRIRKREVTPWETEYEETVE